MATVEVYSDSQSDATFVPLGGPGTVSVASIANPLGGAGNVEYAIFPTALGMLFGCKVTGDAHPRWVVGVNPSEGIYWGDGAIDPTQGAGVNLWRDNSGDLVLSTPSANVKLDSGGLAVASGQTITIGALLVGAINDAASASTSVYSSTKVVALLSALSGTYDALGAAATAQAFAIQRGNHTGTQTMSTISDAGGAATKNVGTTTGTVAAGDDSRITGAAQKASNLSDLANAGTARTNLGLGTLATQSGTFSGTSSGTNTGDQTLPVGGTPAVVLGTAAAAGVSPNFLRRDDTIVAFDSTVPSTQAFGDAAATGAATVASRRDHKHAMPASPSGKNYSTRTYARTTWS